MRVQAIIALAMLASTSTAMAEPPDATTLAKVDKIFNDWRLAAHVPGLVYGIVMDGKVVAAKAQGVQDTAANKPVTTDSLFRIASMSKAFTALAILKLRVILIGNRNKSRRRGWNFMFLIYILLAVVGLLMIIKPSLIWTITESWKSNDATEPSQLYMWSIRFGGVLCTLAAVGGVIALLL